MRDKRANYGVCKANSSVKGDQEGVLYVSKKLPKCAKNKGGQRYKGTFALCLLLYIFSLSLSFAYAPYHLYFSTRVGPHHLP